MSDPLAGATPAPGISAALPASAAYRAGLRRFWVCRLGTAQPPERRWQLRDDRAIVLTATRGEAYAVRRLLAAQHAAELMGCLDRLETRMDERPGDRLWLERLAAAVGGRSAPPVLARRAAGAVDMAWHGWEGTIVD